MTLFWQLLANGVVNGAMFALLGVAFGLVYRGTGIFHVAFGGLFVLSALVFYSLVTAAGLGWWVAGLVAVGLSALAGWGVESGFYRHFFTRETGTGPVMVASLGLGIALENTLALIYGNEIRAVQRGLSEAVILGAVRLTAIQVAQFAVSVSILAGVALAAWRLPVFRVIGAMGQNPSLLRVQGLRLMRYRGLVFALSAALAAVPACLMMVDVGMDVHAGMSHLLIAAVAVLVGGVDRMAAWVAGGFLLAVLQSVVVWQFSAKWTDLVAFALLVMVLVFRRQGLFGFQKRAEEVAAA